MRVVLLALVFSAAVAAQTDVPPRPKTPPAQTPITREQQVAVTVDGCVEGNRLMPAVSTADSSHELVLNALYYKLEGPKELLRTLARDHKGHQERITGIAIIPATPGGATVDTTGVKVGKGKIDVGVRESGGGLAGTAAADAPLPVRLRVQQAAHVDEKCVARAR